MLCDIVFEKYAFEGRIEYIRDGVTFISVYVLCFVYLFVLPASITIYNWTLTIFYNWLGLRNSPCQLLRALQNYDTQHR